MKTVIVGLLLTALCSTAAAAADDWVVIGETDKTVFSIRKGTGEISQNRGGEQIILGVGRVHNKKSSSIDLEQWYVKTDDCVKKRGQLVRLSLKGEYLSESDFVFGAGSGASEIAEVLCGVYSHAMDTKGV